METIEAIELLKDTSERIGSALPLTFDAESEEAVSQIAEMLPLSPELKLAYQHGAPSGEFPRFVQRSALFRLEDLAARQVGWAFNTDGVVDTRWNPSWIVIGDDEGDPFIAHVDRPGTPISVAIHGMGTWKPAQIADSLGTFYAFLAAWSSLLIEDFDGEKRDEDRDFEVKDGFWHAFDLNVAPVLAAHEIAALRSYLET